MRTALLVLALSCGAVLAQEGPQRALKPELSPRVARLLADPLSTAADRRRLQIFHGQWDQVENATPRELAQIALAKYDLFHPLLSDEKTPAEWRGEAALLRGEPQKALDALAEVQSAKADLLRARALSDLGRLNQAVLVLGKWRGRLQADEIKTAPELVAATEGMILLANLEGRPSQDFHLAMQLFGKARTELDPLYWPASLAEATLLIEKDNPPEALKALADALPLNPNASDAWLLLGELSVESYNFDRAAQCAAELRKINPEHLLADILDAESYLQQKDPENAAKSLAHAKATYPTHRQLIALQAATAALTYDDAAMKASLDELEKLAPRSPLGYFTVGHYLSGARQYMAAEKMLREAILRSPNWPAAHVELGLLLNQAGKNEEARVALSAAARLDPFNLAAGNQLALIEALLGYKSIRTERFIIRYHEGIDEVLARDMALELDDMSKFVTGNFKHVPEQPTAIEIMPDERNFAVRITGMPDIWTIAACMGDTIAMTPPRDGPRQRGPYDWRRVLQHEYTHTVTLDQTSNRIPHWFTEACAVSQEPGGRDYDTCQLLAGALNHDKLFSLSDINWGFVRPKTPQDRPLAYAQAHWMVEFIQTRWTQQAIIDMLALHRNGLDAGPAIKEVTKLEPDVFFKDFQEWAKKQVTSWGLAPHDGDKEIAESMKEAGDNADATAAKVAALLKKYPDHPDLLKLTAARAMTGDDILAAKAAVLKYQLARPVDPWSQRQLLTLAVREDDAQAAANALEALDAKEVHVSTWAVQLAKLYRSQKAYDKAAAAILSAVHREPYNATFRETAAAIALQRTDNEGALHHIRALTILEPDRAIHFVRLAAVYARMGKADEARAAAEHARKLDANAPVDSFLK